MFQAKVVEKNETHILIPVYFSSSLMVLEGWDNSIWQQVMGFDS
jgi:hypothetical protein